MRVIMILAFAALSTGCTILQQRQWPAGSGEIVLTFDDGPSAVTSSQLLDVLKRHEVPAVFCYIGKNIEAHPDIVSRAAREGHMIACHTYSHTADTLLSHEKLHAETDRFLELIAALPGDPKPAITHFRPPLGLKTPAVRKEVEKRGFDYAHLTLFINDAKAEPGDADGLLSKVKARIRKYNGGAIVLHEMRYKADQDPYAVDKSWLPAAVDDLIAWARANGYRFSLYRD